VSYRLARPSLLVLAAVLAAAVATAQQPAQLQPPQPFVQPPVAWQGTAQAVVPPVAYAGPAFYPPAYGGWWGYRNPYEGYLNGAANVTIANAQYQQTIQQAKLLRQQAVQESIRTRRAAIDEWNYEQSLRPDAEQVRQELMTKALQRSLNNPPLTEIWDGSALNSILGAVQQAQVRGISGPNVPLDPEVRKHVNLTGGTTFTGVGVFKAGGKLSWPFALRQPAFNEDRTRINELVAQAVQQAPSGEVSVEVLNDLNAAVGRLQDRVDSQVQAVTPTDLVLSDRYLRDLRNGLRVLQQPDVARYFGPKLTAQGNTVGELLQHMTANGLRFAPALAEDRPYYTVLHFDLVNYELGMGRTLGTPSPGAGMPARPTP
jgi:hypothetical protein